MLCQTMDISEWDINCFHGCLLPRLMSHLPTAHTNHVQVGRDSYQVGGTSSTHTHDSPTSQPLLTTVFNTSSYISIRFPSSQGNPQEPSRAENKHSIYCRRLFTNHQGNLPPNPYYPTPKRPKKDPQTRPRNTNQSYIIKKKIYPFPNSTR